jgi:hypothetical protein
VKAKIKNKIFEILQILIQIEKNERMNESERKKKRFLHSHEEKKRNQQMRLFFC